MNKISTYNIVKQGNDLLIQGINNFDLSATLDCGQAFRWSESNGKWSGIAHNKFLSLYQSESGVVLENTSIDDFNKIWRIYFDLDRDYSHVIETISSNQTLKQIGEFAGGIRIIKQDSWEALCSFIISQNNNIPRIKGIISRLCENFGDKIDGGFTFPSAEKLASLTVYDLAVLRSGFRAKYIIDAANKVVSGEIDLSALSTLPLDIARSELMKIKGVGPKVADCALLFGCGRIECFPVDVWIKKAMYVLFNGELPQEAHEYAGIVQQYIFHYARTTKLQI